MKTALPVNAKIAKGAKECMQDCAGELISFITSEASEKCQQEKCKVVTSEDIVFAITSLGLKNYGEALNICLTRYRDEQKANEMSSSGAGANSATSPPHDSANLDNE